MFKLKIALSVYELNAKTESFIKYCDTLFLRKEVQRVEKKMRRKLVSATPIVLFVLQIIALFNPVIESMALSPSGQDVVITGNVNFSEGAVSTYVTGLWGIDYTSLNSLTEGKMNYDGFVSAIEKYFLPMNIHLVMLWINWIYHANTTSQNLIYYKWVDDWLTACDKYGIKNVFYFRQWAANYAPPSWDWDVYTQFPDMQTFNESGYPVNPQNQPQVIPGTKKSGSFFAPDDPRLYYQLKEDLKQICEYYGEHPSWIGIGNFYGDYATYGARDTSTRHVGWGNVTIKNFAHSDFFYNVNSTGYHPDGTKCKIWEMFLDEEDPIKLESENWQDSDPLDVYGGTGVGGRVVAFKFLAPENMKGFSITFYGKVAGSPPNELNIELYRNDGAYEDIQTYGEDKPQNLGKALEVKSLRITNTVAGWTTPVHFQTNLAKGSYYWLVFQTSGGDSSNKYQIYRRFYKLDESTVKFTTDGYSGLWNYVGSVILKIYDVNGNLVKVYPYEKLGISTNVGSAIEQSFTPQKDIRINTVIVHVSDRFYDESGYSMIKIIRVADNAVLAQGVLNQSLMQGLYWYIPVPLNTPVNLKSATQYKLRIEPAVGYSWQFHYIETDPAELSFGGVQDKLGTYSNRDLVFRLAYFGNLSFKNFLHLTELNKYGSEVGKPGITDTYWLAIRINPTSNGYFKYFSFKMAEKYGSPTGISISLYSGNPDQPTGLALETFNIPDSQIPNLGWVNVTGWTYTMVANNYYWIVLKMTSPSPSSGYRPARVPNPYLHKWVWSADSGLTWKRDTEEGDVGDFIIRAETSSGEIFASEPNYRFAGSEVTVTNTKFIAQSFYISTNQIIRGFLIGVERSSGDSGNSIYLELQTDFGDKPSGITVAHGTLAYNKVSHNALYYVNLDFPVNLIANTKYWLVFKSRKAASVKVPLYAFKTPVESYGGTNYGAKVSIDSGNNWTLLNGNHTDMIFAPVQAISGKAYCTKELSDDIKSYHVKKWTDDPPLGWNAYINYMPSKSFYEAVEWLSGYMNKTMLCFDVPTMRMIEKFGGLDKSRSIVYGAIGPLGSPPGGTYFTDDVQQKIIGPFSSLKASCIDTYPWFVTGNTLDNGGYITPEQVKSFYLMNYPLLAPAVYIFDTDGSRGISNLTQHQHSREFGEILSRMRYFGGYFGTEKGTVNVLLIGDQDVGIVPQFLTPALNITLVGFYDINGDYNLTRFGDFSQFNVIVFWAGRPGMSQLTTNAQNRIKSFVNLGGGIVSVGSWAAWANEMFGDGTGGDGVILSPDSEVWKPYTESDFIDSRPHICSRDYGSGRAVHIKSKKSIGKIGTDPNIYGAPKDSWLVLLTNSIFYAAKKEEMLPVWWYSRYKDFHEWHNQLYYSICGRPGSPVLLWVSNNNETTRFEIHLNASFYGIDEKGWLALDVQRWRVVAKGSGEDIAISTDVPAKSWMPIYIMNATSNLRATYSNLPVASEEIDQKSGSYTLVGFYNQTGWLVVSSLTSPTTVIANNTGTLSQSQSIENLNNSTVKTGWYYNSDSKLLFIKFRTTSPVQILITQSSSGYTLADFPQPMLTADRLLNDTIVIASSTPHGPCGGAHTMDVMGATLVAAKLGLKAKGGTPSSILDDSLASYDPQSGAITIRDAADNLIVFGGPGVNMVTKYYNELKDELGNHVLQAYFLKNAEGKDYIYVSSSGKSYFIEYDAQGRKRADYSLIELYNDGGRWVLVVAGLGGEGTWAASKVLATYENWDLNGNAVIVKYSDTNADGYLDTITVEESIYGKYSEPYYTAKIGLNTDLGVITLPLTLLMCGIYLFSSPLRRYAKIKKLFTIATFTFLITGTILMESNIVGAAPQYSLSNFPYPFISESKLLNYTFVVADSNGHAPCGGAHTMDVMGAILVAKKLGMTAVGGMPESVMDDYIASYDFASYSLTLVDTVHNLVSFGGPGVNMVTKYYNDLKDQLGNRLLKAYFLKDNLGVDYIYVQTTGKAYYIEYDAQGRKKTDYAMIQVYYDQNYGRWVLIIAGLGGEGTWAASKVLATYENWSLSGTDAIVKYYDSNKDGYLDTITIAETVA
jgi:hypothetical protein